jgi:hypothetical protein
VFASVRPVNRRILPDYNPKNPVRPVFSSGVDSASELLPATRLPANEYGPASRGLAAELPTWPRQTYAPASRAVDPTTHYNMKEC